MRHCGECHMCCVVFNVPEIPKLANLPCPNLTPAGCGIHTTRPEVCRSYECLWLQGLLTELDRPDQSGILLSLPALDNDVFTETGIMPIIAEEITPGAMESELGKAMIVELSTLNLVVAKVGSRRTLHGPRDVVDRVFPILERLTVSPSM